MGLCLGLGGIAAQAQLSACTGLSYTHTRCENLKGSPPASDAIRSFASPEAKEESFTSLPDVSRSHTFQHQVPMEPIAEPLMPPIDGARDFLNRRDPAHAIQPIQPMVQPQSGLRAR
ncbi:MAG: hypothetical protein OJF47_002002 [Nitrospira sp.]|nr:MAG: hypothetical protein OJF47_002002 [Nitrospira sp.]